MTCCTLAGPYRYHCIILWVHGLEYRDELLRHLEQDQDIEILRLQLVRNFDVKRFVDAVYACDTVPLAHLESKTAYLRKLPPYALFIFIKNYRPEEIWTGKPPFRKTQCQKMVEIKNLFRDKYNPRNNGTVMHDHIIHATDYESQTDYLLKMLEIDKGILCFENDLPFYIPYHIQHITSYTIRMINLCRLSINMLTQFKGKVEKKLVSIINSPHYLGIEHPDLYKDYLNKFQYTYLMDNYSIERFFRMQKIPVAELLRKSPIIVKKQSVRYIIQDGAHRAAIACYQNIDKVPCVIIEQ
jgi:hypothetical protein